MQSGAHERKERETEREREYETLWLAGWLAKQAAKAVTTSRFQYVDLAGSERMEVCTAEG